MVTCLCVLQFRVAVFVFQVPPFLHFLAFFVLFRVVSFYALPLFPIFPYLQLLVSQPTFAYIYRSHPGLLPHDCPQHHIGNTNQQSYQPISKHALTSTSLIATTITTTISTASNYLIQQPHNNSVLLFLFRSLLFFFLVKNETENVV